jgi:hypothetical protein
LQRYLPLIQLVLLLDLLQKQPESGSVTVNVKVYVPLPGGVKIGLAIFVALKPVAGLQE